MKKILLPLFLICSIAAFGQDSTKVHFKRFYVGISFSPEYNYRVLNKNDSGISDSLWSVVKNMEDSIFEPKFGYTGGIIFGYYVTNRISIESGVQYSNKGYKTIPIETFYDWDEPSIVATNIINYYYLDIPLKVNYEFFKKRFQLITSLGAVGNIFIKSTVKTIAENPTELFSEEKRDNDYEYNKFNISASIGIGVKYNMSERMQLRLEPVFKYALLNFDDEAYISTHLWNAGLQFSAICKL